MGAWLCAERASIASIREFFRREYMLGAAMPPE
jgi:hypothetical protein